MACDSKPSAHRRYAESAPLFNRSLAITEKAPSPVPREPSLDVGTSCIP